MLDINLIRENPKAIARRLAKKEVKVNFKELLQWDIDRKSLISQVEELKAKRNKESALVPQLKKEGKDASGIIADMKALGDKITELDEQTRAVELKIEDFLLRLPNLPDKDVIAGGKEKNRVVKIFGAQPKFGFKSKSHIELCESLGLIDYVRGAKIAGNGSWIYTGLGAKLEWALLSLFIEENTKAGFTFMLPPYMLNYECGKGAGQFPKFEDDVYWIDNKNTTSKFLLPTAETALVNYHAGEILSSKELPKKYTAYTACFRREAGSYRQEERGMVRGHQFNKVELVQFTTAEQSDAAFKEMVGQPQKIMKKLGLHYQVSKLAAADCSASMCRTYDIEVWIPSMGIYKEVSSASNAREYQARRNNTRYRDEETKKLCFTHTLNASSLATSRVFPALLEQLQNADGSVNLPKALWKYMGGVKKLEPIKK